MLKSATVGTQNAARQAHSTCDDDRTHEHAKGSMIKHTKGTLIEIICASADVAHHAEGRAALMASYR